MRLHLLSCFLSLFLSFLLRECVGQVVPLGLHGSPEYVDMTKNAPRWAALSGNLALDAAGWPAQDFEWILDYRRNKPWCGPDFSGVNTNASGVYHLSFQGTASLSGTSSEVPDAISFVNQTYDESTQTTSVDVVFLPGHYLLIITFANTTRPGQSTNTGLTNIKFYLPGYSLSDDQLFTNEFLELVTSLHSVSFRCFDTGINGFPIWYGTELVNNTWADRSLPTDAYWPLASRNEGNVSGLAMPWEIFMQIVIQTNTPGWFNLPVGADDEYITNFALLLKNGNNYTKALNPDQPFYIEYSNEVWNWGFSQSIYMEVKAKAANMSNLQFYVQRVFQISAIFRQVFGDAAMGTQVRFVCMWQYSTWNSMQQTLQWAQTAFGNPVSYYIWGIGEAPYVNPLEQGVVPYSLLDPQGVDRIMDSFYTSAGQRRQAFTAWQAVATFFGINVVGYESGPSLNAGIEGEVSRSMRMKDFVYRYYMENYFPTGAQTVNWFALGPGGPGAYGDWYLFEHWGEYDYGKLEGYQSVSGQPYPDLIVGYVLPWTNGETIIIDPSQYQAGQKPGTGVWICSTGCWPDPAIISYLLRSSGTGEYQVTLFGNSQSGASIDILLDNQLIKTVSLPTTNGNISIPFQISAEGLHTLALQGSGSGRSQLESSTGLQITLVNGKGTPIVPSAPLNLVATSVSEGVSLIWEPVSTATGYTIQRSTTSGGPYTTVGTSPNNTYVDSSMTSYDIMVYYVVTAQNSVGSSALSIQVQVIPVQQVLAVAPTVTISSGLQNGGSPLGGLGQVFLQWNPVANAQSYTITRNQEGSTSISTLNTNQLATVYYDTGLTPNGTYYYNVTSVNVMGSSPPAQVSTTVPLTSAPGAPSSLTVNYTNGIAYLQWNQAIWSYPEFGELFIVEKQVGGSWETLEAISTNNFADVYATSSSCYQVWGSSSKGGNSATPSNTACA